MENLRSYVTGMLLSFIAWEAWEDILLSLIVALVGGFSAAAGRQAHKAIYNWWSNRKIKEEENEDID